ncbi:MAG: magnesium chelatase [Deltaproteobacteria bacterium]|nr:MAG: magnesium chelatase [Deltaproteobacteria bacterium]
MLFTEFVGHKDAKLALILNLIDPQIGGVLFVGKRGTGKSTLARAIRTLAPELPFIELPLNVTEDALLGGVDLEETIGRGERVFQAGLLARAHGGVIYVDEVNLLNPEILSLLFEVQSRGENLIEREGMSRKHPSSFAIIASMNPEEGDLGPHFLDRFGMCVGFDNPNGTERLRVLKRTTFEQPERYRRRDERIKRRIILARELKERVSLSDGLREKAAELCLGAMVAGHRADIALIKAARAYAAFCGQEEVTEGHLLKVLPLVLLHRRRFLEYYEQEQGEQPQREDEKDKKEDNELLDHSQEDRPEGQELAPPSFKHGGGKEEVFEVGEAFRVRRLAFRKDRRERVSLGRRTKTRFSGKGGRYVRSLLRKGDKDIALDATLRAAAPWQLLRGRKDAVIVKEEDLRFKERERRLRHLVIFVVDGSGSMGANRRMVATKGAIQSLLLDCYQKRDKVSLIVFRKDRAEVVLPPTSSVELASKRLKELPVGGKTPLGAGLLAAYNLIKQVKLKHPETRFLVILVSDGRANQGVSGLNVWEEIKRCAMLLREVREADCIVVDTEDKSSFLRTDLAFKVASLLEAGYFTMTDLRAEGLVQLVAKNL